MEQDLISKKDLLDLTDISYGQLYRWKRKSLIPEEWFIRKSTFTGQETFFPREKILARIDKIKNMKDDLSLDELADVFSPSLTAADLTNDELLKRNIVSPISLNYFLELHGPAVMLPFEQLLYVYVLDKLLQDGTIGMDEGKSLIQVLTEHYPKFEGKLCELILLRKMGMSVFLLHDGFSEIAFETGARVVVKLSLNGCMEELKVKIGA